MANAEFVYPAPEPTGVLLDLTLDEAVVLRSVLGVTAGVGPLGDHTDSIYEALGRLGVPDLPDGTRVWENELPVYNKHVSQSLISAVASKFAKQKEQTND